MTTDRSSGSINAVLSQPIQFIAAFLPDRCCRRGLALCSPCDCKSVAFTARRYAMYILWSCLSATSRCSLKMAKCRINANNAVRQPGDSSDWRQRYQRNSNGVALTSGGFIRGRGWCPQTDSLQNLLPDDFGFLNHTKINTRPHCESLHHSPYPLACEEGASCPFSRTSPPPPLWPF